MTQQLYTSVTNRIIQQLKEGVPPWARPWKEAKGLNHLPANAATGRPYSGVNVLILYMEALEKAYPTHGWMTFMQANQVGAKVRKGEKSTQVVFVKHIEKEEDGEKKKSTILKAYPVFNVTQLENLPTQYIDTTSPQDAKATHDAAVRLMEDSGLPVFHGGTKAAYYPACDQIVMPPFTWFEDENAYWGTLYHEACHYTGHKDRLNRQLGKRFGDKAYASEELVAELGSAFTCARLGIPASFRSASYIDNWLEVLERDNRAIFTAASYASQATEFLFREAEKAMEKVQQPQDDMADEITF